MDAQKLQLELSSIRNMMERSAKFMSLSGISGVLAGIYALIGAGLGYWVVYGWDSQMAYRDHYVTEASVLAKLFFIALAVLVASLLTGWWLSVRKARRQKQSVWNAASRSMLKAVAVPLVTGGLFVLIQIAQGHFGVVASACLLFYGMALMVGSGYTYTDIRWLGAFEIVLGLLAAAFPGYGIVFWATGFGVLHIIYGMVMYRKYDRRAA